VSGIGIPSWEACAELVEVGRGGSSKPWEPTPPSGHPSVGGDGKPAVLAL